MESMSDRVARGKTLLHERGKTADKVDAGSRRSAVERPGQRRIALCIRQLRATIAIGVTEMRLLMIGIPQLTLDLARRSRPAFPRGG